MTSKIQLEIKGFQTPHRTYFLPKQTLQLMQEGTEATISSSILKSLLGNYEHNDLIDSAIKVQQILLYERTHNITIENDLTSQLLIAELVNIIFQKSEEMFSPYDSDIERAVYNSLGTYDMGCFKLSDNGKYPITLTLALLVENICMIFSAVKLAGADWTYRIMEEVFYGNRIHIAPINIEMKHSISVDPLA